MNIIPKSGVLLLWHMAISYHCLMEFRRNLSMSEIDADQWNRLARFSPTPLMSWDWLEHLEERGGIDPGQGWAARHLTVHEGGEMIAAVPLYLRNNSWGEFVFDFAFAELAEKLGKTYYPKLVGMSPASPTPAFSFLIISGREEELTPSIFQAITDMCRDEDIPVLQFNFVLPEWKRRLGAMGMCPWEHQGFEWRNESFTSFDDYLARFRKNQRRNIIRERRSLREQGITMRFVPGTEAPDIYFDRMAEYYLRTNSQFGPYAAHFLSSKFFTEMPERVRQWVWFAAAHMGSGGKNGDLGAAEVSGAEEAIDDVSSFFDDPVALAMLLAKNDRLIGRYWGSRRPIKDLHFNTCYYTPIEWAIERGLTKFDPGMGSPHKLRRGFRAVPNWSLHYFFDPDMQWILETNMGRINAYEESYIQSLDETVPYKEDV